MGVTVYLVRQLAIGQKLQASPSRFGEGHNLRLEIGVESGHASSANAPVAGVVKALDHRLLGLDVNLGFEPTLPALARWIAGQLQNVNGLKEIRLKRGDGAEVRYGTQPPDRSIDPPVLVKG